MSKVKIIRLLNRRRGEISFDWGLALAFCQFHEHASLHLWMLYPNMYITLPKFLHREPADMIDSWGFSWRFGKYDRGQSIHFNWGSRTKIIHMPWDWTHVRTSELMADGNWRDSPKMPRLNGSREDWEKYQETKDNGRFVEIHPYQYKMKNGTVQERTATIKVDEREWRWRWFKWLGLTKRVSTTIDVTFNDEVGERTGSWKGGTIGCGYEIRHGETPVMTLRRMERERVFN